MNHLKDQHMNIEIVINSIISAMSTKLTLNANETFFNSFERLYQVYYYYQSLKRRQVISRTEEMCQSYQNHHQNVKKRTRLNRKLNEMSFLQVWKAERSNDVTVKKLITKIEHLPYFAHGNYQTNGIYVTFYGKS